MAFHLQYCSMNYALNLIMKSVVHQSVTGLIVVKYKNMYSC